MEGSKEIIIQEGENGCYSSNLNTVTIRKRYLYWNLITRQMFYSNHFVGQSAFHNAIDKKVPNLNSTYTDGR